MRLPTKLFDVVVVAVACGSMILLAARAFLGMA